jgi:hypothetical protein
MNVLKLRKLLENIQPSGQAQGLGPIDTQADQQQEWTVEEKKIALEAIGQYNQHGKQLYREWGNLMETAHKLSEIAKHAQRFLSKEIDESKKQDAWFDTVMVERNMKDLQKCSDEFTKYAKDAHILEQRMQALYEQMGTITNRYFEVKDLNETSAPVAAIPRLNQGLK